MWKKLIDNPVLYQGRIKAAPYFEGWYFKQAKGFVKLLNPDSDEYKIYKLYSKNYFTRLLVIFRYNFSLIRSTKKAIQFLTFSLFEEWLVCLFLTLVETY